MRTTILYDPPEIEYLDGHPYPKVSPKRTHALVQLALGQIVKTCAGERGEVGSEWRFDLGKTDRTSTEVVLDLAFVSHERLDLLTDDEVEEPPFAPDIAIEIRSPSNRSALLERKIRKYLATGSVLVLDVDPQERCILAHDGSGVRVYAAHERFTHLAVPWLAFDIAPIFPTRRRKQ